MKSHHTMLCMQSFLIIITGVYGIEKQKLVFSTPTYLKEIDLDTGVVQTLTKQNDNVFSLAYDNKERYMYVPRYNTGDIVRFSCPTNHTVILKTIVSTSYPFGIAFDSVNTHLYWTELSPGRIKRCNTNGSNVIVLLNETLPAALTLDIQNRWIYYGQHTFPSEIFRINFDGTDKRIIIKNLPTHVFGIGVDVDVKRLYWMEYHTGDLRSAWINGSDVKTIITTNATSRNWDIDIDHVKEDLIFYTSNNHIMKINKSLGQNSTVVHTDTQPIYGLLFYKPEVYNVVAVRIPKYVGIQLDYSYKRPRCCMIHDQ